jgi:hypothetical protein
MRQALGPVLIVLALAACGSQRSESPQSTTTAAPITQKALAAMVPPPAAFPRQVRTLTLTKPPDAAVTAQNVTNAKASANTPSPTDSGADLAQLGRTGGYQEAVSTYSFVQTIAWAEASVDAFTNADEAQRYLEKQSSDLRAQDGKEDHWKRTIANVEPVSVSPGLDPATGFHYSLVAGPDRLRVALVGFRVGRVVGWSNVARVDNLDPLPLADELAQTLRRQMERVGA